MRLSRTVVAPRSLMQEMAGSSPFTVMKNILGTTQTRDSSDRSVRTRFKQLETTNTFLRCSQLKNIYEFIIHFTIIFFCLRE